MNTIERINEIKNELISTPKPKLGENSLEDWDDLAQARLEYNWWKRELEEELSTLEHSISSTQ
jgi:hypothetical protein